MYIIFKSFIPETYKIGLIKYCYLGSVVVKFCGAFQGRI